MITFRGLPIMGNHSLKNGLNYVDSFSDPIRGTTMQNGVVIVKDNRVIGYGLQPHALLWKEEELEK
jgi:hypothetical protein